jgi:hypothetical protein
MRSRGEFDEKFGILEEILKALAVKVLYFQILL